ncbi:hypothetical protein L3Q82_004391 [Scortum barcoo]|uniref:Uncharacterized protein n=1 Tax=Scortum barcoo TaxID=214431 RepID=A0ACB8VJY2_9TELE|nr:hypothetical protein L3Q82_004391 [Scortum barcoo]
MDALRTAVFVLFVLPAPVSCNAETFFTEPVICYVLDGFLIVYCIIATVFLFREKDKEEENGAIYQELERPKDADPYQVLEPSKKKKKAGKKKKAVIGAVSLSVVLDGNQNSLHLRHFISDCRQKD